MVIDEENADVQKRSRRHVLLTPAKSDSQADNDGHIAMLERKDNILEASQE